MKCPREIREEAERSLICSNGVLSADSLGRPNPEEKCPLRTAFQLDVDRITHSIRPNSPTKASEDATRLMGLGKKIL